MAERVRVGKTIAQSLSDVGYASIYDLLATYGGRAADLKPWLADAQRNGDGNLRLQYLAGLAADVSRPARISDNILAYRKFPDDMFVGSEQRKGMIRSAIQAKQKTE
jgi:hypothetical protein